jgi:hypothetical protein
MPAVRSSILLATLYLFCLCTPSFAQLPHARLDRAYPLGGAAGSDVVVEIVGQDLDAETLHFDHPGFKSKRLEPNKFRVCIAADVPEATYELRAVGKFGVSNSRLFAVSRGMTEVAEKEPNDAPEQAQAVPLNAVINGKSDGNGDDYFRFPLKAGQRVVIDCWGYRLDSMLRAALVVSSADGKELVRSRPYHALTDPLVDFVAPADGDYLVRLHDTTYSGDLPYRLVVSTRPHIESVFPPAVVPGEKTELTVYGRNLPGGKPAPEWTLLDRPLEAVKLSWAAPKEAAGLGRFDFREHPAGAASVSLRGLQPALSELEKALSPATLIVAPHPVIREQEPNDTPQKAQRLALPATVCGRLDRPGDADWYTFTAKAGESFAIDLHCERLGRPGDLFGVVINEKGEEVANIDDHGINVDSLTQYNRDPQGVFTAPADGKYRLLIQDRYRSGGARFIYVFSIGKPRPDFSPIAFHASNPEPTCPLVRQGGSTHCELCLNRLNFSGPVVVEAKDLPAGVTFAPVHVSPQTETAPLVFTAAADAPQWSGPVRLVAWAMIDGKRVERPVCWAERRLNNPNSPSRLCRQLCLAVRPGAPYAIKMPVGSVKVAAGGSVSVTASVERMGDFKGKVQLNDLMLPPGFAVGAVEAAEGKNAAQLKLTVADNVPAGSYTVVVRGDAQVPFRRDPKADPMTLRVADPSTPLTVVVTPVAKK